MRLRVLIADDEEMARRRMRRLLSSMPDVEIVAEAKSGEEALLLLDAHPVDVALLDVHMGRISGLTVSDTAAELGVEVVLTTAHAEHAVEAFDKGAVDYLLKPIDEARLVQALRRVRSRLAPLPPAKESPALERLALEVRGEVLFLKTADISHALLEGELVTLFTRDAAHLTELSLTELEAKLPSLLRVHRRALLALDHVSRLVPQPTGGYLAKTHGGHEVPVSRQAARELRRRLGL
jgi:two-component system, LytTR family, response regulator